MCSSLGRVLIQSIEHDFEFKISPHKKAPLKILAALRKFFHPLIEIPHHRYLSFA